MANPNTPIPQSPIGENFQWRDWFQKLSNRVYGSLSSQNSNGVDITGGTIDNTAIGSKTPSTGSFTSLKLGAPLDVEYGGTNGFAIPRAGAVAYGNGGAYAFTNVGTSGQVLTSRGSAAPVWSAAATGTVTSVGLSLPSIFSVSGSPVTSSGTLTGTFNTQAAALVFAGPATGSAATPTFRALVASDLPSLPYGTGTVTSVSGTGTVNGITLTGTVTTTGSLTLGGTLSGISNSQLTYSSITVNGTSIALGASGSITAANPYALTIGTGLSGSSYIGSSAVTIALANTTVSAGSYTYGSFTVDAQGRLTAASSGTAPVTSVAATAPIASSGGTTPTISISQATTSTNGYLSSTDWNTFNNKQPAGTYVTSVSGTSGRITSSGGTTPAIDLASGIATPGTTGSSTLVPVITIDTYGRVTSITTAANPQGTVTAVTGTAPVVSSGGTTPAISMAAANGSTNGYLTSTDWTTFNNKQPAGTYVTSISVASSNGFAGTSSGGATPSLTLSTSITGLLYGNGTALAAATISSPLAYSAGTLSIGQATTSTNGYLSSTDWNTFNNKQPAGSYLTAVTADAPLSGSGTSGSHLVISQATTSTNGYLSSTDWNTFNNKQAVSTPVTISASTYSVGTTDLWLINNYAGTCTLTLPTASSYSGRQLNVQNYQAYTVVSASSNVVSISGGSAGTAILNAIAGDRCTLVSNGTNWLITEYTPNNILLLN